MRLIRFLRHVREMRRVRVPLTKRNLRALWRQSEAGWLDKQPFLAELTDEEYARWQEAIRRDYGLHA